MLLSAVFMAIFDFFIVNVALPAVQHSLHSAASSTEWLVSAYGLAFAALLIAAGRLGDRFGRRRALLVGLGMFTVASAGCGLAPTLPVLIAARVAQGAGAAFMIPSVLGTIGALLTGPAFRAAIARYALAMALGAALGQVLGGLLLTWDPAGLSWRLLFLINVPIGVAAMAGLRLVPETRAQTARALDPVGIALYTVTGATLMLPLVEGRNASWAPWTWGCFATAAVLGVGTGVYQWARARRGYDTLIDPAVFGNHQLLWGLAGVLIYQMNQPGLYFVLAYYLQIGRDLSPLGAGLLFSVLVLGYIPASLRAASLTHRYGRRVVWLGTAVLLAGYGSLWCITGTSSAHPSLGILGLVLAILGVGQGLAQIGLTTTVLQRVDAGTAGTLGAVVSSAQQVGGSIGVALAGTVYLAQSGPGRGLAAAALLLGAVIAVVGLVVRRF